MPQLLEIAKQDIIDELGAVWSAIDAVCEPLTVERWSLPTACPGWTVQDVVSHIIGTESMLAGRPQPTAPAVGHEHVMNDIGALNEAWVSERRQRPPAEVLAEFREVTGERLAALESLPQSSFDEEAWTPAGHSTYGRFMQIRVFDSWMHEQDIRRALAMPGGLDGPAVDRAFAEISLALGYVVGKRAGAPRGASVALVVNGPTIRRFDVIVEERARVSEHRILSPTATVATDLETFIALVGGRVDPVPVLDAGGVDLGGDIALARAVVEHLAFVI